MDQTFKFSIVTIMENKSYLKQSIESVVNQTIGFEENVQLILIDVNFAGTKEIASKYINRYPNNIVLLSGEEYSNRYDLFNLAFTHIKGEYVNFLTSYDKLSKDALKHVYNLFSKNNHELNVASIPTCKFDGKTEACSNFEYNNKVIDLNEVPKYSPIIFNNSFFKCSAIKLDSNNNPFNPDSDPFGQNLFISSILFGNPKVGLINDSKYYYRKRNPEPRNFNAKSAINIFELYFNPMIEKSLEKFGKVPVSLQYAIVKELGSLIKIRDLNEIFSNQSDIDKFWDYLNNVLSHLDMENIIYQLKLHKNFRNFLIYLKNNREFHVEVDHENNKAFLMTGERIINRLHQHRIYFDIVEIKNGFLNFTGSIRTTCDYDSLSIEAVRTKKGKKEVFKGVLTEYPTTKRQNIKLLGVEWIYHHTFDIKIPLDKNENSKIEFRSIYEENGEKVIFDNNIKFRKFSGISIFGNYFVKENHMLLVLGKTFLIQPYSFGKMVKAELKNSLRILKGRKSFYWHGIFYRFLHLILFPFMKDKRIWIFIDREDAADDNAEQLFKYVVKQKDDVDKYFIINKDNPDYERLNKITTNIVPYDSLKHKIYVLFSEKIISSQITRSTINPLVKKNISLYSGAYTYDICFLQHGVTKDDVSHWFRKFYNNLHLIVTVSDMERDSMLGPNYHYDEEVIQTLGFPRYDYLNNDNIKKQILFVPTWRQNIIDENSLLKSEYYSRINSFFNNERLIKFLKDNDYEILFKPHPNMRPFIKLLDTKNIKITDEAYPKLFNESRILITDYSSVAFDFAYLEKPVIYYHYGDDYHFEKGYFEYETMGFGPVIGDEDDLVDRIIDYIENDCKMEDNFKENVGKFFKYTDKNNCKRNYEWLLEH